MGEAFAGNPRGGREGEGEGEGEGEDARLGGGEEEGPHGGGGGGGGRDYAGIDEEDFREEDARKDAQG